MNLLFSIVSHDQALLVQNLINSLDCYLKSKEHNITIVVTENSLQECRIHSKLFEIKQIYNLRPKGFGANHNTVFEQFANDLFFIVNPDITLKGDFNLDRIVELITEDNIDITSPVVVNPNGTEDDYRRADLTISNVFKRVILRNKKEHFDWLAGMFLIVKARSFRELRGFDTKFFMYVEDCDLCIRAKSVGMKIDDMRNFTVIHNARRASKNNLQHLRWHISSLIMYWISKLPKIF